MTTAIEDTLYKRLEESIESGQPGIWIRTHEPEEALLTLAKLTKQYKDEWDLKIWDADLGLQENNRSSNKTGEINKPGGALSAVRALTMLARERYSRAVEEDQGTGSTLAEDEVSTILLLRNGHREFVNNGATNKEMLMAVQHLFTLGKAYKCFLIILSYPGVEIPVELIEQFWVFDHELPDYDGRKEIIAELLESSGTKKPSDNHMDIIVKATGGLTRGQVEAVCSLSLLTYKSLKESVIWRLKTETLNKKGLLQLWKGKETFADVGGLNGVKKFCKQALRPGRPSHIRAKAILLLGIPGTGKSAFSKALGNEMHRPTLSWDVGAMMGSLVGQTEERTREALQVADAMEPCQIFVDEIEKALGGGGDHDGGVGSRLKGSVLTWLNDHTSDVFFIATANDISKLPPEFTRAERFDAIFFMDLPGREQKDAIWAIYTKYFDLDETQAKPDDEIWTGAEIRACCRLAALLDVPLVQAAKQIVPVMLTAKEQIANLREWAHKRCLDAETGLVYKNPAMKAKSVETPTNTPDSSTRVTRRVGGNKREAT